MDELGPAAGDELSFEFRWFPEDDPALKAHLGKFNGMRDICGVEIGCWEGRSTCWMLANAIDGAGSLLHCIDPWGAPIGPVIESRFGQNVAIAQRSSLGRIVKHKGQSQDVLPTLAANSAHFAYVDGSHLAADVLTDMVLAWRLLREGGVMVCDDYELTQGIEFHAGFQTYPEVPPIERPKMAIDAFLNCYEGRYNLLHKAWQVILEKRPQ